MRYMFFMLTLLLLPFSHSGCSEDDTTKAPIDQLPPLTTTGENTFGYLVNGEALVVRNTLKITAIFQQGNLQLGGVNNDNYNLDITIFLNDPLGIDMPYNLIKTAQFYDLGKSCFYELEDTYEGSITFSKIDRVNFIISGVFNFSTVTSGCDTVRITDGRFDVQYIP